MSFALSGIATGMDTTAIVEQLIALEGRPQMLLQQKSQQVADRISAFQGLNARLSSVTDAARKITTDAALRATRGSSSDESVTVTSDQSATAAALSVRVDRLAQGQASVLSQESLNQLPYPPKLQVAAGTELITLEPATGDMRDVAQAINSARDLGLTAVMVRVGAGDQYVLQVTGESGEANAFSLRAGEGGQVLADPSSAGRRAQDARLTLDSLGRTLTSATNTFEDVMPGIDLTVSRVTAADAGPAQITVAQDDAAATKVAKGLVDNVNLVLHEITAKTRATTKVTDGRSTLTPGLLGGDSLARSLQSGLTTALSYPVDGTSPAQYGISVGRDGTFAFDEAKFAAALTADPRATNDFMTKLAARVQETSESFSDPKGGIVTDRIASEQGSRRRIDDQVGAWDTRLDNRRATLQRTYAAMETAIAGMQQQQSWLTSQLAGLPRMG